MIHTANNISTTCLSLNRSTSLIYFTVGWKNIHVKTFCYLLSTMGQSMNIWHGSTLTTPFNTHVLSLDRTRINFWFVSDADTTSTCTRYPAFDKQTTCCWKLSQHFHRQDFLRTSCREFRAIEFVIFFVWPYEWLSAFWNVGRKTSRGGFVQKQA